MKHTTSVTMETHLDPRMLPCMFEKGEKPHTCSLPNEGRRPHGKLSQDGIQRSLTNIPFSEASFR